jgi:hypothetical protein
MTTEPTESQAGVPATEIPEATDPASAMDRSLTLEQRTAAIVEASIAHRVSLLEAGFSAGAAENMVMRTFGLLITDLEKQAQARR